VQVQLHSFLTSAPDESAWSRSRPFRFTPSVSAPDSHRIGDWVSPETGLDVVAKSKNHCPCRESNPIVQLVAWSLYWLNYPGTNQLEYFVNTLKSAGGKEVAFTFILNAQPTK
jgi:hypothetical protein